MQFFPESSAEEQWVVLINDENSEIIGSFLVTQGWKKYITFRFIMYHKAIGENILSENSISLSSRLYLQARGTSLLSDKMQML